MLTLNPPQEKAVKTIDRNILVLAGAGTGKTRIIIAKIFYLLSQKVMPTSILAITFTNKAAEEMRHRLQSLLKENHHDFTKSPNRSPEIRTFHSFGALILRSFIHHFSPYQNNFTIIDTNDQKRLLKEIIKDKTTDQEIKVFLHLFSTWKNQFIYPDDPNFTDQITQKNKNYLISEYTLELYRDYCRYLAQFNLVDFDDLIGLTVRALRKHEACYHYVTERWKYLLVDEYQDTNLSQENLIETFIKAGSLITAVGDDCQSIYAFRGACLENILSFNKKYQAHQIEVVKLEENYRSTSSILNLANEVIVKNPIQFKKKLFTQSQHGEKPIYRQFQRETDEAQWIYQEIQSLIDQKINLSDIAVLYRTNYQSRLIEDVLLRHQIPYQILGGFKFYERKEIKEVISYLNFLINPFDQVAFFRLINFPPRGIGEKNLEKIKIELRSLEGQQNLVDFFRIPNITKIFSQPKIQSALITLQKNLEEILRLIENGAPISKIIDQVIEKSGIYHHYSNLKNDFERDQRLGNLDSFMDAVIHFEDQGKGSLQQFMEQISLGLSKNEEKSKVNLLTVHNAKGLEYRWVFVLGMEEGTFPHYLSIEENNLEEERRLFYVAITRAQKGIKLSSAEMKRRQGTEQYFTASRFIREIDQKILEKFEPENSLNSNRFNFGEENEYF